MPAHASPARLLASLLLFSLLTGALTFAGGCSEEEPPPHPPPLPGYSSAAHCQPSCGVGEVCAAQPGGGYGCGSKSGQTSTGELRPSTGDRDCGQIQNCYIDCAATSAEEPCYETCFRDGTLFAQYLSNVYNACLLQAEASCGPYSEMTDPCYADRCWPQRQACEQDFPPVYSCRTALDCLARCGEDGVDAEACLSFCQQDADTDSWMKAQALVTCDQEQGCSQEADPDTCLRTTCAAQVSACDGS